MSYLFISLSVIFIISSIRSLMAINKEQKLEEIVSYNKIINVKKVYLITAIIVLLIFIIYSITAINYISGNFSISNIMNIILNMCMIFNITNNVYNIYISYISLARAIDNKPTIKRTNMFFIFHHIINIIFNTLILYNILYFGMI